ncbi:DUF72 domain-containing protein [Roseateles terrae]|uniref:Uncharacterized protein YecE (DUF72 family) n=1 Tax=Roseateles terrae TaxID=431060 RepID=A0ABR6GP26_9BURK|nr:DUF72 domain-containing protein [Roseateles terrae]MBB3193865.1 uncharacterized protein YecE (DUF72 family) [Roseateles terrae]
MSSDPTAPIADLHRDPATGTDAAGDASDASDVGVDLFGMPVVAPERRTRKKPATAEDEARDATGASGARRAASAPGSADAADASDVQGLQEELEGVGLPSEFGESHPKADAVAAEDGANRRSRRCGGVAAAPALDTDLALAAALSPHIRIGTSSWSYPGWQGQVWAGEHSESVLSRQGLSAYAQHPLLRAVGIDRGFYQSLTASQFERYANLAPEDFRFMVKAPSAVTDALVRSEDGRGRQANAAFLNPTLALKTFVEPAFEGLGSKAGALVFQLSPLPLDQLARMSEQMDRLWQMLRALPPPADRPPGAVLAVEVRDPEWLCPDLVALLKDTGAVYCLGLHPKLPPIQEQLPLLRALWPGPLVARWNLHRKHGPYGYEDAQRLYGRYDERVDPDPETLTVLSKVMRATAAAGHEVLVTISNHAEGSAPLSARALVEEIVRGG